MAIFGHDFFVSEGLDADHDCRNGTQNINPIEQGSQHSDAENRKDCANGLSEKQLRGASLMLQDSSAMKRPGLRRRW